MDVRKQQGVVVLSPTPDELEDIGMSTAVFERLMDQAEEKKFVMDLGAMEIIFSVQIGTLVAMYVLCREKKGLLRVVTASPKVKALLHMVGLDKMIEVYPDLAAAVRAFAAPAPAAATGSSAGAGEPRAKR